MMALEQCDKNEMNPAVFEDFSSQAHRHTPPRVQQQDSSMFPGERRRTGSLAPSIPQKSWEQTPNRRDLSKSQSFHNYNYQRELQPPEESRESFYISPEEIASYPSSSPLGVGVQEDRSTKYGGHQMAPEVAPRRYRSNTEPCVDSFNQSVTAEKPPKAPNRFHPANNNDIVYTEPVKRADREKLLHMKPAYGSRPSSGMSSSPSPHFPLQSNTQDFSKTATQVFFPPTTLPNEIKEEMSTANPVYCGGQVWGSNYVMDLNRIQKKLASLYKGIADAPHDSPLIAELKSHLRLSEHEPMELVLKNIHSSLAPSSSVDGFDTDVMYIVDFRRFHDKHELRQQIIQMFAKPGPPSTSYAKVDAKMDSIITEFCSRVETMRTVRNEYIESPAHVRSLLRLHGILDNESFVKALQENQLWIRWGTLTNLPPLSHLYMNKQPPSYEVRKAVTISYIAERQKAMPDMIKSITDPNLLCPPIYSRLSFENSSQQLWQVTEYKEAKGTFESHPCNFPSWLDDEQTAIALLKSSNRTVFEADKHSYALYSVYVVIIKDFTLAQEESLKKSEREQARAIPSKCQYYIGSSSTGVLYRFTHTEDSHCNRAMQVLQEAPHLQHFRCYEGCDLVEACLALSWARKQPRAVFVLNSFLPSNMSNLTLEMKRPFNEKMLVLASHLIDGKKTGPLCDMRYGMNGATTN